MKTSTLTNNIFRHMPTRISVLVMLIVCFGSDSVLADMSLSFQEMTGESTTMLFFSYDDDNMGFGPEFSRASFFYHSQPLPDAHDYLNELTHDDGAVSGRANAYYGYIIEDNGFTINLGIDSWVKNIQNVESLRYQTYAKTLITICWSIDMEPWEKALMKVEIDGAIWDEALDEYFSLGINDEFYNPLDFAYDGTYYTTYLPDGNYLIGAQLLSSLTNTDLTKECHIYTTFEVVPLPSAVILGSIGLTFSGWLLKRRKML